MSSSDYELVFRGEFIEGFDPQEVKARFSRLFRLSEERVEQIFSHPRVVFRKGLSRNQAEDYLAKFEQVGLRAYIDRPSSPPMAAAPTPPAPAVESVPRPIPPPPAATQERSATEEADHEPLPFRFSGAGGEYFKIWIVNILLTILTLGIYSAWAKVRNKQYFYGNTTLEGSSFVYLAKPITILKGRLVAFALFALYMAADALFPPLAMIFSLLMIGLMPFLVVRSLAFNAYNSAYRNVRFGFDGSYGEAFKVFALWPFAALLTLGLLMPMVFQRQQKFIIDNCRYGSTPFEFTATPRDYYQVVLRLIGVFILGALLSAALGAVMPPLAPVAMLLLYLYAIVYFNVAITNIKFNNSLLAEHGFACNYDMRSYTTLFLTNSIATVLTLGLYLPWAKVRNAQYMAEHLEFVAASELDGFTAQEAERESSIGQEIGDVFDMDIGF